MVYCLALPDIGRGAVMKDRIFVKTGRRLGQGPVWVEEGSIVKDVKDVKESVFMELTKEPNCWYCGEYKFQCICDRL